MIDLPLVSIVLPTFNGEQYLTESVRSCLDQTYRNIELIIVDDCSSDRTPQIVDNLDDPRVVVLHNEVNEGLPASLNKGFRHSRGSYLTWTSDDNWYCADAIETMQSALRTNPAVGIVYSDYWIVDSEGKVTGSRRVAEPDDILSRPSNEIGACFLYRRDVYEKVGEYSSKWKLVEDYDYWIRIAKKFSLTVLHVPLYHYRYHPGSLTSQYSQYRVRYRSLKLARHHKIISLFEYVRGLGDANIDAAFFYHECKDRPKLISRLLVGLMQNPKHLRNLGVWSIFTEALFGEELSNRIRRVLSRP